MAQFYPGSAHKNIISRLDHLGTLKRCDGQIFLFTKNKQHPGEVTKAALELIENEYIKELVAEDDDSIFILCDKASKIASQLYRENARTQPELLAPTYEKVIVAFDESDGNVPPPEVARRMISDFQTRRANQNS